MPKKKKKSRAPKEPSPTPEPVVNGAAAAARVDDEQATVVTKGDEVLDKSVGKTVFIRGLVSRADLNGARGTILDYNAATERFTVECAPPQSCTVAVKRANLQIAKAAKSDRPRETPFAPMLDFGRLRRWTGANLSDAFEAAVPPTYRMAMAQMKCGIPTRSIAALPAGAQWLYNESYVSQQISDTPEEAHYFICSEMDIGDDGMPTPRMASKPAICLRLCWGEEGDAGILEAPAGLAGVDAGAPLIPVMAWFGTANEISNGLFCKGQGIVTIKAETDALIAYGRAELARRSATVHPDFCKPLADVYTANGTDRPTISFLAPPNDLEIPLEPKAAEVCSGCGRERGDDEKKFKSCARCNGASYCSRGCQVEHWPQHKKVCKSRSPAVETGRASCLVSTIPPDFMQGNLVQTVSFSGAAGSKAKKAGSGAPRNIHGENTSRAGRTSKTRIVSVAGRRRGRRCDESTRPPLRDASTRIPSAPRSEPPGSRRRRGASARRFIVKVQLPLGGPGSNGMIYDRQRSFQVYAALPEAAISLVRGCREANGMKAYIEAKREGENLRLFVDRRAPMQPW